MPASTTIRAYAPIVKTEVQDDGSVLVSGPAADAGLDRDRQRLDQAWLDQAMPEWMAESGNVREQHDPKRAVGVGVGLTRSDTGSQDLVAAVVDPVAIRKVLPGPGGRRPILKGFSIGVKDPIIDFGRADAPNGLVVGGKIVEVSLVDRPSNPRTVFAMVKADGADDAELEPVEVPEVIMSDEVTGQAAAVLAEIKALVPDLEKLDAAGDIAEAQTAIACIARIIASEAGGLAAGEMDEAGDIDCLLDAVRALKWFIQREASEPAAEVTEMLDSDAVKADTVTEPEAPTQPSAVVVTPETLSATIRDAVTEATGPLKDELTLVKADLARLAAMPMQGGPVGARTGAQTLAARERDALSLVEQANALLTKADSTDDAGLAAGYRERAAALRAQAER